MVKRNVPRKVYDDAYYARNRERVLERNKAYEAAHPEKLRELRAAWMRRRRRERRAEIIAAYGGRCQCCGESNERFLAIDHVNGGGSEHRKRLGTGRVLKEIVDRSFPPDFQLLCHNCNMGRAFNDGVCPHEFAEMPSLCA
jgi:hypothetical protein